MEIEVEQSTNRFGDRMKGILDQEEVWIQESMAAAHRITTKEDVEGFLKNPEEFLRETDSLPFQEMVRSNIKGLMASDIDNHALCRHLNGHHVSSLAGEATFWDIQNIEMEEASAEAIFTTYNTLQKLPPEAHKIIFPIYFKGYTLGHSLRVGAYSSSIAQELGDDEVTPEKAAVAGFLHDLGKMQAFIHEVVQQPRKLTPEEYETVKLHPTIGATIWNELQKKGFISLSRKDHLMIHDGVLEHHVRPDGKGYPEWIQPGNISLIGKIISIADSFDAMTSYRKHNGNGNGAKRAKEELKRCSGLPYDKAITMLKNKQGEWFDPGPEHQFDPALVEIFLKINPKPIFHKAINQ